MTDVTVRVPAKVNLLLSVGPPRPDGYHDLVNIFHAISLFDEVTAEPADELTIELTGATTAGVPAGPDNLAARAARLLAGRLGIAPAVRLRIDKQIPVAGGMAGGSADAAAALLACSELWNARPGRDELFALAAELGSDVPFALLGGTAVGVGRGEVLTPLPVSGTFHWVIVTADGGLSTPAVYAECDALRARDPQPMTADVVAAAEAAVRAALAAGDVKELGAALGNDLQPAALALRPSLRRTLQAGVEAGAVAGLVSGSGPSCAFLAESAEHAELLAERLGGAGVARSVHTAHGPVEGAAIRH